MATQHKIADLQAQFGIPGIVEIVDGNGGLAKVRVHSSSSSGEIYLHGAQVTSWTPANAEEIFFLSSQSRWEDGHAIRGGIPICFPWFRAKADDPHAPSHGFVRTKSWGLESVAQVGDAVAVTMTTASGEDTKKWWPADFRLLYRVTFGSELTLELTLANVGSIPARFEEALHCYFSVGSVAAARVRGLDGTHFLDNTRSNEERAQQGDVVLQEQTDNAYINTQSPLVLEDSEKRRRIHIAKENSLTTVVWNPWREGASKLSDLGNEEWTEMLCVEPCNILNHAVTLAAGQQHTIRARIQVKGL
jgi:glucose-6-phosphate 1-epimerase